LEQSSGVPAIDGLGTISGFKFIVEDRDNRCPCRASSPAGSHRDRPTSVAAATDRRRSRRRLALPELCKAMEGL
jgi:hypothetical protein